MKRNPDKYKVKKESTLKKKYVKIVNKSSIFFTLSF